MENNFRENKEDILKERLDFREDTELAYLTEEDKKHYIQFVGINERIIRMFLIKIINMLRNKFNCLIEIS